MAVIKQKTTSTTLQTLTAAALLLPGLLSPAAADDNTADFQYSHYQEGQRQLYGTKSSFDPIEVDTLHGGAKITLADRIKFAFNYTQDTWSGATPVTTAPLVFGGNKPVLTTTGRGKNAVTTITGASPLIQPSGSIFVDKQFNPLSYNPSAKRGQRFIQNSQLVHTLSSASPETRQQADFKLGYDWDELTLNVGGGISVERDYESRFVNLGSRWDLNQKQTSLNFGLSYTNSSTFATLDHYMTPYIEKNAFFNQKVSSDKGVNKLFDRREDWATQLGLTQVLDKNSLFELGVGYTHSSGYMSNPYKVMEVLFVDPKQKLSDPIREPGQPRDVLSGTLKPFLEQRPELRNEWNFNGRYVQYIDALDAALHLDYRFYHDDWGINAHTFELEWGQPLGDSWLITPRFRYYSQDAADFYAPFLVSPQAYSKYVKNKTVMYDASKLPDYFSSDQRLSGFGALSGGVTVSKKFAKGVSLEAGFEYYTHKGAFKLDGGGEGDYADFHYYTVNAALKVNLATIANSSSDEHAGHHHHGSHTHSYAPAGVMFDHLLSQSGQIMLGYRYMYSKQGGAMLHGSDLASDKDIKTMCGKKPKGDTYYCTTTPSAHTMQMHMLDIMYAPTDWLNLMLMPQFMTMDMNLRQLDGAVSSPHAGHEHTEGGIGDTSIYALVKLFDNTEHHLHIGLGISAPTGSVGLKLRPIAHSGDPYPGSFTHYGMQLGSGTWDFKPSLTYTGQLEDWSWGAQFNATKRLENSNKSGFAFGDIYQSTIWGSYSIFNWLSASVRGVYTNQSSLKGEYNEAHDKPSPLDLPANYGGQYWDVGFGLNATVTGGDFAGNRLAFEWLQPVADKVNGYQLDREGALSLAWGYAF